MKKDHSTIFQYKGDTYRFDIYLSSNFSPLKNVTQVYGIVVSKDHSKLLVVFNNKVDWILPGGTIEKEESLYDTLIREVKEETNRDIKIETVKPFFYQSVYKKLNDKWEFMSNQVRFIVEVENDIDFISDPDEGDITEVKWIKIEEIPDYLDWGKTSKMMAREISKVLSDL